MLSDQQPHTNVIMIMYWSPEKDTAPRRTFTYTILTCPPHSPVACVFRSASRRNLHSTLLRAPQSPTHTHTQTRLLQDSLNPSLYLPTIQLSVTETLRSASQNENILMPKKKAVRQRICTRSLPAHRTAQWHEYSDQRPAIRCPLPLANYVQRCVHVYINV
jgi:hypothetical protein